MGQLAMPFSDGYTTLAGTGGMARERVPDGAEFVLQRWWYEQRLPMDGLVTDTGIPVRIVSPGWWNRSEGPDFLGAQIQFGQRTIGGDIEIHLNHGAWKAHGHHLDPRYDKVILVVALESAAPKSLPRTSQGRPIPNLLLGRYVQASAADLSHDACSEPAFRTHGFCAAAAAQYGRPHMDRLVGLAGDWRMLRKAQALQERMAEAGENQAVYEAFLTACGYSRYRDQFRLVARQMPYDRLRQLALQDPLLAECALLQIAGLLPEALPDDSAEVPHFHRLRALRGEELPSLRPVAVRWRRVGVRPINYPERRLAGVARFVARSAGTGLGAALRAVWRSESTPRAQRSAFEALFPTAALGFWAQHCTWTGRGMKQPSAPIGAGRVRSIIGNVFIAHGLAAARAHQNRGLEEAVYAFYRALPQEPVNKILKPMVPRVYGAEAPARMGFRLQQGLLQLYEDWCQPNPSCRHCPMIPAVDPEDRVDDAAPEPAAPGRTPVAPATGEPSGSREP